MAVGWGCGCGLVAGQVCSSLGADGDCGRRCGVRPYIQVGKPEAQFVVHSSLSCGGLVAVVVFGVYSSHCRLVSSYIVWLSVCYQPTSYLYRVNRVGFGV